MERVGTVKKRRGRRYLPRIVLRLVELSGLEPLTPRLLERMLRSVDDLWFRPVHIAADRSMTRNPRRNQLATHRQRQIRREPGCQGPAGGPPGPPPGIACAIRLKGPRAQGPSLEGPHAWEPDYLACTRPIRAAVDRLLACALPCPQHRCTAENLSLGRAESTSKYGQA